MRIIEIVLKNYRAFYGEHTISLDNDGKNLMIFGENGSGKSSLFTALKTFFQSSVTSVDVEENIFVPASQKNTSSIKLTIKEAADSSKTTTYELTGVNKKLISNDNLVISDANKIKAFFDYKSLLRTHLVKDDAVNLFHLLLDEILVNSENRFTKKELGPEWLAIHKAVFDIKQTKRQQAIVKDYITKFNNGLKELLSSIESDTNTYLSYFNTGIKVKFDYPGLEYIGRRKIEKQQINLDIDFCTKNIPKHHFFLNEARLSALAICIYLASIKVNPSKGRLRILVLDDLLIGLDMSNRLPLLQIIKDHFETDFQIIMTTYDKVWYELVNNYFENQKWKYVEVYSKRLNDSDFEIPIIFNNEDFLERAEKYLVQKDYKASAVYVRTEFEKIVKSIADKKHLIVSYKKNPKEQKSDDFWESIVNQTNIDPLLVKELQIHRGTVMNPFSHYDLEKPEFEAELRNTIDSIKKLKSAVSSINKIQTFEKLQSKIDELKKELVSKENTIKQMAQNMKP